MKYFDSHTHIGKDYVELSEILPLKSDFIFLNVGVDYQNSLECLELAKQYLPMYASVGLHPNGNYLQTDYIKIANLARQRAPKLVAIGECGLDYYYKNDPKTKAHQRETFVFQIKLAIELDLPIIIHCREAIEDLLLIIQKYHHPKLRGVLHTYASDYQYAIQFIELGFYISFSGVLTFKNAKTIQDAAKRLPIEKILVETDAPFLTPVPYRGKRNSPYYLKHTVIYLAKIRNMDVKKLQTQLLENSLRLFSKINL